MGKMLNIINNHGNAVKTVMRYHLTPVRMIIMKKLIITDASENVNRKEPLDTVCRKVN